MDIKEIKSHLDIIEIAHGLGIRPDKNGKALCPFHNDKKPSLQFSKDKQIATCFSSNCSAGTMDVISLTEKKLNVSTHEALKYLSSLTGLSVSTNDKKPKAPKPNYQEDFEQQQSSFIASSTARNYLESRAVDWKQLNATGVGYNAFKSSKFSYLRGCVTFALRDEKGQVVSLYGRSVRNNDRSRHYYTSNRTGLYPAYPKANTQSLILTESIIDAATLLSVPELTKDYEVLALYGTNGLTAEHSEALSQLKDLQEVVIFFDGDEAGREATLKHGKYLQELLPEINVSVVETLEGEDINSLAQSHTHSVFLALLKTRKPFVESLDTQKAEGPDTQKTASSFSSEEKPKTLPLVQEPGGLDTSNPNKITYLTETAAYYIKGGIRKDLDSLKVTLVIERPASAKATAGKSRNKLDLYEDKQTEKVAREAGEKLNLRSDLIETDLNVLTDLLDEYRETLAGQTENEGPKTVVVSGTEKEQCLAFLRRPNLLKEVNELIGKSGVVGEHDNRVFLFCIAASYRMPDTLHALIQGSSGSGKTHLLATIMDFMPPEDTISLTRVTESSFYNYGKYELQNKLIGMEDYDGLEEKAELAFRELQSKGMISSSTSGKNEQTGEITGFVKEVYGPIASLSATTQGEIYEDNMSRCFLVAVDESAEQTAHIIKYQNQRAAGKIDKQEEKETRAFLRNCIRLLQPYEVVNPYADKIELPKEAHKIRRLNDLFQSYVKQVTILNQYQRQKDQQGRLITDKEDVKTAIEIMFDSIILKVDELDGSLRDFYERLKKYVLQKDKENNGSRYEFTRREIRQETRTSNTQLHRYMKQLLDLEYIYQSSGYDNRGHKYKIQYWDDNQAMREKIRQSLTSQLEQL